jgi:hypothetical protein
MAELYVVEKTFIVLAVVYVICAIAAIIGWAMNLLTVIHLLSASQSDPTVMLLVRIVGIPVFVIGAILGWF